MSWLTDAYHNLFGMHLTIAPINVATFILIAWAVYLARRETGGFLRWLFPRNIWQHDSVKADVLLLIIGRIMSVLGIVARFAGSPAVAAYVASSLPGSLIVTEAQSPILIALLLWLTTEFATYWTHRGYHTIKTLWPLHAVHHSAEVLTPLTTYRQHPLGILVSTSLQTVIVGVLLGLLIGTFDPQANMAEIAGVNAFVVLANATVANFHHSHLWISFGPLLEHFIISPAQHQIHHSTKPEHYNRNYGQILAIWDWFFGTLYVIRKDEKVSFGLNEPAEAPLMTHRLGTLIIDPVRRLLSRSGI